jgi:hypothetical protein
VRAENVSPPPETELTVVAFDTIATPTTPEPAVVVKVGVTTVPVELFVGPTFPSRTGVEPPPPETVREQNPAAQPLNCARGCCPSVARQSVSNAANATRHIMLGRSR